MVNALAQLIIQCSIRYFAASNLHCLPATPYDLFARELVYDLDPVFLNVDGKIERPYQQVAVYS